MEKYITPEIKKLPIQFTNGIAHRVGDISHPFIGCVRIGEIYVVDIANLNPEEIEWLKNNK